MSDTIDIEVFDISAKGDCMILVAPVDASGLSSCLGGAGENTATIFTTPVDAWNEKVFHEASTESDWMIIDVSDGLDCGAKITTEAEFKQFYSDWL